MVAEATLVVFLPAAVALILAPGPDTVYVLTRSIQQGRRRGFAAAVGIGTGVLVHTGAAVLGVSVLLRQSAVSFRVVQYLGALYLLYLGVDTLLSRGRIEVEPTGTESASAPRSYLRGVVVDVLNPKVALFFLAFLPQFAPSTGGPGIDVAVLGGVYALLTVCYLGTLALFAGTVRAALAEHAKLGPLLDGLAATVLLGLGIRLLVE